MIIIKKKPVNLDNCVIKLRSHLVCWKARSQISNGPSIPTTMNTNGILCQIQNNTCLTQWIFSGIIIHRGFIRN